MIFLLGLFWKGATAESALVAAIGSFLLSIVFREVWPELPFIDRVGIVFALCGFMAIALSILRPDAEADNSIRTEGVDYSVKTSFIIGSVSVTAIVAALYVTWW